MTRGLPHALHAALGGARPIHAERLARTRERASLWWWLLPWPAAAFVHVPLMATVRVVVAGILTLLAWGLFSDVERMAEILAVAYALFFVLNAPSIIKDFEAVLREDEWVAVTPSSLLWLRNRRVLEIPWDAFVARPRPGWVGGRPSVVLALRSRTGPGPDEEVALVGTENQAFLVELLDDHVRDRLAARAASKPT